MRKSRAIRLSLVGAVSAAALAAGCGSGAASRTATWETCVDGKQTVVDQKNCDDDQRQTHPAGYVPFYRSYYFPSRLGVPSLGTRLAEGSFSRPSGVVSRPSVVRGGFGASTSSGVS